MKYEPDRGDIVRIRLSPQSDHEQAGRRPAIVLSPQRYNSKAGLMVCCPITSKEKNYPFEVKIPGGLPVSGVILSDQVKSLDWRVRQAQFVCKTPKTIVQEVIEKLTLLFM